MNAFFQRAANAPGDRRTKWLALAAWLILASHSPRPSRSSPDFHW